MKRCLRYCKSTIFQANHNSVNGITRIIQVVCDTAKVRFFKQITTDVTLAECLYKLFAILQKYDFSSKSQPTMRRMALTWSCLRYCKSTIFQANHNEFIDTKLYAIVVCDTAKVRFFKQITTIPKWQKPNTRLFAILQKYDFSSKSQLVLWRKALTLRCLRYCKSTIFQANHNGHRKMAVPRHVVCDTAKVRFFKQITTITNVSVFSRLLFAILQKYDFSSKSQRRENML